MPQTQEIASTPSRCTRMTCSRFSTSSTSRAQWSADTPPGASSLSTWRSIMPSEYRRSSSSTRKCCYSAMQKYAERKDRFFQIWHAVETFRSKERLAGIGQPTLIVSPDRFTQAVGQAKHMAKTIPNSERVIVRDAGHMVMMDNPEGFNRELESFPRI